jgi:CheY-like chemotaxis protein
MVYILILLLLIIIAILLVMRSRRNKPGFQSGSRHAPFAPHPEPVFGPADKQSESDFKPVVQGNLPYSVLIVDDQPAIRMLLRELFQIEGVTVYEAPHGRLAIEQVRRNQIDFILLDLKMPDMDGIDALKQIRTFNSHVKVAMITAYGDPDKLEAAKRLGTLAFFTKPFDIEYVKNFVMAKLREEADAEGGVVL